MLLSGLWHGAGWNFLLWGAMHAALMLLEGVTRGFWQRAPAALTRPLVLIAVFLAWVPFRAGDFESVVACYAALGRGGWAAPSLGFVYGAMALILVDVVRVPLRAGEAPAAAGWLGPIRIQAAALRGVLWPAAGIVFALLTHLLWGAAEKDFIYFRF
jgi:alginate O-acetyltransferase complex protein AlgI